MTTKTKLKETCQGEKGERMDNYKKKAFHIGKHKMKKKKRHRILLAKRSIKITMKREELNMNLYRR